MTSVIPCRQMGTFFSFLIVLVLVTESLGQQAGPCQPGWTLYDKELPPKCLRVIDARRSMSHSSKLCHDMNATLMRLETDEKYEAFKEIAKTKDKGLWIPLMRMSNGSLAWYTYYGSVPVTTLPRAIENLKLWYIRDNIRNKNGLVYRHEDRIYRWDQVGSLPYSVCEKQAGCTKGRFGSDCDKECHCHGQECNSLDLEVTCRYGCQLGWMGKDCSKRKEDAVVRYFCVNSKSRGQYLHLRIYIKGVQYDNIHAVDPSGKSIPWCNGTLQVDSPMMDVKTIKTYINDHTKQDMLIGSCAGKMTSTDKYEWRLRIQETTGIVSRNDQEIHIECDFNTGEDFEVSGEADIKRERWFRRQDVKRPLEYLVEKKETVELAIVDPFDGSEFVSGARIGSPVVLKITFAVGDGDEATGVIPYDCYAATPDFTTKAYFLDEHGCPDEDSPISAFYKNGSKSIITKPFNMFGFEGTEAVDFHCSFALCFDNQPCHEGCFDYQGTADNNRTPLSSRRRRTAEVTAKGSVTTTSKPINFAAKFN